MDFAYLRSPKAKKVAEAAKAKALQAFKQKYSNADISKFVAEASFLSKGNATAEVFYIVGPSTWQSVSYTQEKDWPAEIKKALGLAPVGGFFYQLALDRQKPELPIPAVDFSQAVTSVGEELNKKQKIYVTPT